MLFNQLKNGDEVYILEIVGTFKKTTEYNVGSVVSVSKPYDEPIPQGQYQMSNLQRKKIIDVVVLSSGESKKFTIPEDRSSITDSTLGLTIATDKQDIVNTIRGQYNTYKAKKESITKCDEEMERCLRLLDKLEVRSEPKNEDSLIKSLQDEVNELKNIIKQANQMVPSPMKQMLPQDMQDVMNKVGQ